MSLSKTLSDPSSNLSRMVAQAQETMKQNEETVAAWMARGLTHEQAWAKALAK